MDTGFFGNLSPENFDPQDFIEAIQQTHEDGDTVYCPPGMNVDMMKQLVVETARANKEAGRELTYVSALSWGITIGVVAERLRRQRTGG